MKRTNIPTPLSTGDGAKVKLLHTTIYIYILKYTHLRIF